MVAAVTLAHASEELGVVAAAALAAVAVLARSSRAQAYGMAGALLLTPVLLVSHIWSNPQFQPVRDRPALALAGGVAALVAIAIAAFVVDRHPPLLALAAVAVLPFRVPIQSGGSTSNLLVPLYFVIAAGAVAFIVPRLRGRREARAYDRGAMEWLLLGAVVLYALQSLYSADFGHALEQLVFFYIPFALLFRLLVRVEWTARLAAQCLGLLVVLAVAFCGVGFVEYYTKTLLLNPQVIASNQFQSYFRVNSLFFDPNIFGRFLIVVMLFLVALLLHTARRRVVLGSMALLLVLWAGLVLTLSQSSLAALLLGLVVLAALRWSAGWTIGLAALAVAAGIGFVVAFPGTVRLDLNSDKSVESVTSGRGKLISGGLRLFEDRPVLGYGSGAFSKQYRGHEHVSGDRAVSASHTIPVTVAAEQGALGLLVYLALLITALLRLFRGARGSPVRAGIAAAFVALVGHTWLYAAFLEDPLTWALLAVGTALAVGWREEETDPFEGDPELAPLQPA